MQVLDSRRLTGPGLLLPRPGAVLEVLLDDEEAGPAVGAWRRQARRLLAAVGWAGEELAVRRFPGGASLAFTAPIDALYAATEVNEEAWAAARAALEGGGDPPLDEVAERLRAAIRGEESPALRALAAAAGARGVAFLCDAGRISVGLGAGSLSWPAAELPAPGTVDWERVHDVPVALVTGTNGKTTTVRLLAAMAEAAGKVAGLTSTDRVEAGGEVLERGDFSGPEGARLLLRDPRVELAVLEAARGGILRRGLAVARAEVALITNVAEDHLGEFGVHDLEALTDAKLVVARVVPPGGRVVLNADDAGLAARGSGPAPFAAPVTWFGLDPASPLVARHLAAGGEAALLDGDALVLARGAERREVTRVDRVPLAFGGAARYNLANALAALAAGAALGLPLAAMAEGLARVGATPEDSPGRANLFDLEGVQVLLDYAHNPHGVAALLELAATLPAKRRLVLLGQAGDRTDEALRDLAQAVWRARPDRVVVKELTAMLRGRAPGEVPAILEDELRRLGAPAEAVARADSELEAVREALAWARPGDLLLLLVHTDREAVIEMLLDRGAGAGVMSEEPPPSSLP